MGRRFFGARPVLARRAHRPSGHRKAFGAGAGAEPQGVLPDAQELEIHFREKLRIEQRAVARAM